MTSESLPTHVVLERELVVRKLPPNTRLLEVDGVYGWLYAIVDELGDPYTMFVYNDGSSYQVKVVEPEVEGRYNVHNGHLFPDGRICLDPSGQAMKTLEQAYAKSVLWANGFSAFIRTGIFPFSVNNQ